MWFSNILINYHYFNKIQTKLEVTMQNQIKYDYNSTETSLFVTSSLSDQSGVQESGNMAYVQHMTMAWDRLQIQVF